ncbi:unnamed protein product [Closterium sp. NIES-64]|nr:unnamed protein product [Closterium sp. NIES-64]
MQYGLKLLMGTRKYKETEVRLPGIRWTFKVIHTGGVKALDELFSNPANQPGFVLQPERILAPDGVLFSAAESPSLTDSENCPDRDISCIIRSTIFAHNAASSPPVARPFSSFGYNAKALPCAVRRRAAAKSAW